MDYIDYSAPKTDTGKETGTGGTTDTETVTTQGDGGNIELSAASRGEAVRLAAIIGQKGDALGTATVRIDKAPIILAVFDYGEEVRVLGTENGVSRVFVAGIEATMERRFIFVDGEENYKGWQGYTTGRVLYDNMELSGEPAYYPGVNASVDVINDLGGGVYLVRVADHLYYASYGAVNAKWVDW